MNTFPKRSLLSLPFCLLAINSYAQPVFNEQPITASAVVTNSQYLRANEQATLKDVVLMNLQLTTAQKQALANVTSYRDLTVASDVRLPAKVEVNMNGVPVLDQGQHGTCVTFATTAALDSLLQKGDYVSPLCNLMLGKYLAPRSYYPSGWNGSIGPYVLSQIEQFGIVTKAAQHAQGCAGMKKYPIEDTDDINRHSFQDIREYKSLSQNLNEQVFWKPILTFEDRFAQTPAPEYQPVAVLKTVKTVLADKTPNLQTRITFGVMLPYLHCSVGACASYHKNYDTWALSKEIIDDNNPDFGGHEMMIIGYDDKAVAKDKDGTTHKGLLKLRNSWGNSVGDNGDYYMSYDFFKKYALEVQKITYIKN